MNRLLAYNPELEFMERQVADEGSAYELEFGADLLGIASRGELEDFLRELIAKVGPRGQAAGTPLETALVEALKRAAQPLLPLRRGLVGSADTDAAGLKRKAARIFGLELEGLSPEDMEFEVAQHFVRFAADTIRKAAASAVPGEPERTAQSALALAARQFAPGLLTHGVAASSGRWVRQGSRLIVLDC